METAWAPHNPPITLALVMPGKPPVSEEDSGALLPVALKLISFRVAGMLAAPTGAREWQFFLRWEKFPRTPSK